jgi:hypothetical protein
MTKDNRIKLKIYYSRKIRKELIVLDPCIGRLMYVTYTVIRKRHFDFAKEVLTTGRT